MPKRGRRRKKTRTHNIAAGGGAAASSEQSQAAQSAQSALTSQQEEKVPKSLVIRRGKTTSPQVADLVSDLRQMMMPYTAAHFEEDAKNRKLTLNQYVQHLALPMGISHLLVFSQTQRRLNMRLARTPEGPTLTFRVTRFSLNRDIKALQRRPVAHSTPALHGNPPVVVTNNFGGSSADSAAVPPHVKLMRITFQNLFPAVNVSTVKLRDCRRVVLFQLVSNGDGEDKKDVVQVRHYAITAKPVGVNRRVRRLLQTNRKLPNLNKCQDIAEYLESQAQLSDGAVSDSEAEEDETQQVVLSDSFVGRGNAASQRSALKLVELGPRIDLHLIKVEKGLGNDNSDVLYHAHVHKTPEEAAALKRRKQGEISLKEQRRSQQEANVERKRRAVEEKRAAKRQKQLEKQQQRLEGDDSSEEGDSNAEDGDSGSDVEDDDV